MIDLDARANRARAIAEGNHGRVISRDGDVMTVEVPADISPSPGAIWSEGGFSCTFAGRRRRISHCRVIDMNGHTIVRHQMVTTAFYRYAINLTVDTRSRKSQPSVVAISAQTSPFKAPHSS